MKASRLLLLIFIFQGGRSGDGETFCTAQRGSIIVEEKGSVTIPCNFTYPEEYRSGDVRVFWRRGLERCGNGEFIYNQTKGTIHTNYTGRISSEEKNKEKGTTAITIRNLRRTDGPMFCCRIEIYKGSKYIDGWHNRPGTQILFKDEFSVQQTDVVPAIIGEDITIPCLVHYKDPNIIEEVTWSAGSSDLCVENNELIEMRYKSPITGRLSVVNFPQDLSLRINKVTSDDIKQYCCKVRTKLRGNNGVSPIHSTQVILAAESKDSKPKVEQPKTTSPDQDGSATLSCSYQSDTDPLWTAVFWRAGGPGGIYAYHPLPVMVDPRYRGRTELRGSTDLHIKGVNDADNTTYYCFVMLRFCVGNNIRPIIRYGSGTRLHVNSAVNNNNVSPDDTMTWLYVLAAVLAVIILFAVVIIILKKKGVVCQKHSGREDVKYLTSDVALRDRNTSNNEQIQRVISSPSPPVEEDTGGILYAHLNVSSLQQKTSQESKGKTPDDDAQVLYAAVKPTTPPQDIYSTVHK
ncbi:uncharacterized protein LOC130366750 [Hyla sarda]|uniref:uncharacterized protein LOC130366750 n=1 Tax=Hyla sarda TaxID=327740 RepID=UPI0024C2F9F7|nr:uncharacterized protein LOC130366750 [Hyla sarda]